MRCPSRRTPVIVVSTILGALCAAPMTSAAPPPASAKTHTDGFIVMRLSPPPEHVPDADLARANGLVAAYVLRMKPGEPPASTMTVALYRFPPGATETLAEYVAWDKGEFARRFPDGTSAPFPLPAATTRRFEDLGIEVGSILFEHRAPNPGGGHTFADSVAVHLRTPAGVWTVSWSTMSEVIRAGTRILTAFLDGIEVERSARADSPLAVEPAPAPVTGRVVAPKLIARVAPEYPEDARRAGTTGAVVLGIVVDETGAAGDVEVVEGLSESLDRAAIDAVTKWLFQPGTHEGKPVRVYVRIVVTFEFEEKQEPGSEDRRD